MIVTDELARVGAEAAREQVEGGEDEDEQRDGDDDSEVFHDCSPDGLDVTAFVAFTG